MAISTYLELKTAVENWLTQPDDSDIINRIPEFIALAESDLAYGNESQPPIRHRTQENETTLSITSGVASIPSDFLEAIRIKQDGTPALLGEYVSPSQLSIIETSSGNLKYYTFEASSILFEPQPSGTVKLLYHQKLTAFSSDSDTNSVLTDFPGLYLYGSLLHAVPYLKEEERVPLWQSAFNREVEKANRAYRRARPSGGVLQVRTERMGP